MNQIDLWIGLIALVYTFFGYRFGLVNTLASIVLILLSTYLASSFAPIAVGSFRFLLVQETVLGLTVFFFAIFLILYLAGEFLLAVFKNIIQISVLGPLDKVGGLVLGFIKGLVICAIFIEVLIGLPPSKATLNRINSSFMFDWGKTVLGYIYPMAVRTYAPKVKSFIEDKFREVSAGTAAATKEAVEAASQAAGEAAQAVEKVRRFTP